MIEKHRIIDINRIITKVFLKSEITWCDLYTHNPSEWYVDNRFLLVLETLISQIHMNEAECGSWYSRSSGVLILTLSS